MHFKSMIPLKIKYVIKQAIINKRIQNYQNAKKELEHFDYPLGVNLIGNVRAEMGLGQSCRLVAKELTQSKIPFTIYNVNFNGDLRENDRSYEKLIKDELPYAVNLFHVNPCELGDVVYRKPQIWNGRYNIAFWLWELEEFPEEWVKYCNLFDEIWTPSEFAGRGIRKKTNIPVKTMPYSIETPTDNSADREFFQLPTDKFLYLMMYDSNSTMERKNPLGAIEAYKKAFPVENNQCGLVIKINNAKQQDLNILRKELENYKNVYLLTTIMTKEQVNSLVKCADVLISLHRAEGFGLVMAEAMELGTPVIATNWSSNTEFMDEESSCMVDYKIVKNPVTVGPYKAGAEWAQPDIQQAAEFAKKLYMDKKFYSTKKDLGKKLVEKKLNTEMLQQKWKLELKGIFQRER